MRYRVGTTLATATTRRWTAQQRADNEREETRRVFEYFRDADQGRSRRLVATCGTAEDATLIARALNALKDGK